MKHGIPLCSTSNNNVKERKVVDPSMIIKGSSEDSALYEMTSFVEALMHRTGSELETPVRKAQFFIRLVEIIDMCSPITSWNTGALWDLVPENPHPLLSLPFEESGLWQMRVVPLEIQTSDISIKQKIIFDSRPPEEGVENMEATHRVEKRFFVAKGGRIIAIELSSKRRDNEEWQQPYACMAQKAHSHYLADVFQQSNLCFDWLLDSLEWLMAEHHSRLARRLRSQNSAQCLAGFARRTHEFLLQRK